MTTQGGTRPTKECRVYAVREDARLVPSNDLGYPIGTIHNKVDDVALKGVYGDRMPHEQ